MPRPSSRSRREFLSVSLLSLSGLSHLPVAALGRVQGAPAGEAFGSEDAWVARVQPGAPAVHQIASDGEAASYWPRWRGPSGQGHANGGGYPDTWSATQNVLWKTPLSGRGNSSPIVWGDRIFLTTAHDGGRRLAIVSIDRSDGNFLWESFAPDGAPERIHAKNSHASATPVTDGERVYASFGSRGLMAVDFDGELVWHRDLGRIQNYHGTAGSPLLYEDRLIIFQDHRAGSFVAALDTRTGETIWRTDRDASVGWGTPIALRADDHDEIIVSSQGAVYAYTPDSGRELWRCEGNLFEVIPTPVVGHGLVFCSSGRAGPTLAIRPGGHGDVSESHLVWKSSRGSPFVPSPVLHADYLYLVNDMSSIVTCLEATTGELVWQQRLGRPQREGFSASPVVVDDKLFFTNDLGTTFVVKAGADFELLHTNEIGARTFASPALVDGRWYIRTEDDLVAVGR